MTTLYIGAKFDGHDSAIFLILPASKQVYGLATERLTSQKHDDIFPIPTLERLIRYACVDAAAVTDVRFANSFSSDRDTIYPINKLELDLASRQALSARWAAKPPESLVSTIAANLELPESGSETLRQCMRRHLRRLFPTAEISIRHQDHEYCHALSSYFFSPFEDALLVTMDGAGDNGNFSRAYVAGSGVWAAAGFTDTKLRCLR